MKIHISNDERVAFIGTTGSGKTVLAKRFLARLNRIVVIDPKHTFKMDGFKVRKSLPLVGKQWKIIYRPQPSDDEDLADFLDDLFRIKNVTIYVDEMYLLMHRCPLATDRLSDIVVSGREKHVAVWTATQRPRRIPVVFISEIENYFLFTVRKAQDRDYMTEFMGEDVFDTIDMHDFWYFKTGEKNPALMTYNMSKNYIESLESTIQTAENQLTIPP